MREYVQRGEIEGRIIAGRWRFRRADLDAFSANAPRNRDFAGKNDQGDPDGGAEKTGARSASALELDGHFAKHDSRLPGPPGARVSG